jgi:hypothetical protein
LAAAGGRVVRTRDEIADKEVTPEERKTMLANKTGCGNGLLLDHGNGWQTIYCHMKRGSLQVKPGHVVEKGDILGQVGMSGIAEFPHLHLGVLFEGRTVDPFTGLQENPGCSAADSALWNDNVNLPYAPVINYAAGFTPGVPEIDALKIDTHSPDTLPAKTEALVFWSAFYGVERGDKISLTIYNPDGTVYAKKAVTQPKTRARQFYYIGRKPDTLLQAGVYRAISTLERQSAGNEAITTRTARTVTVE